jgi:hypothetical protein
MTPGIEEIEGLLLQLVGEGLLEASGVDERGNILYVPTPAYLAVLESQS